MKITLHNLLFIKHSPKFSFPLGKLKIQKVNPICGEVEKISFVAGECSLNINKTNRLFDAITSSKLTMKL